ncbi:anaerobic ribonucleoside-triphosphate reductase activating protein [Filimonas zeae]|uniref:Anaerobic ribonucleoside-triphosphate reductase-activating protein n=1 Tax=Filimonas zeae TaxID=1737353 RepID=A0A917IMZ9_9BACT|nr:4Fe-4S single cluster domain-containing protein [Filimonas zeae]MDR6337584.1 anaerobic ribonucleoside-triphosphate reductase activating protein [Filimonas zeae]GGH59321.1 anaerobic ribonucleoside-triphosphate reductase-activating protein [Filimonas zeae]
MKQPLYIHNFIPVTAAEGPGNRACLWVQGCAIRCKGCMVPHTWDKHKGRIADTDQLIQQILATPDIEGLTVLGGEPMDQAEALLPLLQAVTAQGLSLMLFSGYTRETLLASGGAAQKAIIDLCDIFVDGPYMQELTDFSRPWVGSSNQRIFFQTPRYQHLESQLNTISNKVEIRINDEGTITLNGMLPQEQFNELRELLKHL